MNNVDILLTKISAAVNHPTIEARIVSEPLDRYSVEWKPGKLLFRGTSSSWIIQGSLRALSSWKAGYPEEALGHHAPSFHSRYLCLESGKMLSTVFALTDREARRSRIEALCEQALFLGYNGIQIVDWKNPELFISNSILEEMAEASRSFGLKFSTTMEAKLHCDLAIYHCKSWDKPLPRDLNDRGMTKLDQILDEMTRVRKSMSSSVTILFYVSSTSGSVRFWESLLASLPVNMSIGIMVHPADDYWNNHRSIFHRFPGAITPIFSLGSFGAGLWPLFDTLSFESVFSGSLMDDWRTGIVSVPFLPASGSFFHCSVWGLSQKLWNPHRYSIRELLHIWYRCFRPDICLSKNYEALKQLFYLAEEVKDFLHSDKDQTYDQQRAFLEYAFAQLKYLSLQSWDASSESGPSLNDCVRHCLVDLRRYLLHRMLQEQVAISQVVDEKDLKGGFWTFMQGSPGQAVRSGAVISLLENPQEHKDLLSKIVYYWEVDHLSIFIKN